MNIRSLIFIIYKAHNFKKIIVFTPLLFFSTIHFPNNSFNPHI